MANRLDIENCDDVNLLRALAINQSHQLSVIGEILVEVSKLHRSPDKAIDSMRHYLTSNQCELDFDWIKMKINTEEETSRKKIKVELPNMDKFFAKQGEENDTEC